MIGTTDRPNANPVLRMMRDADMSDPWGTAMSYAFAACDVLYDADPDGVPPELGYVPGMGGPEVPTGSDEPEAHRIRLDDLPWETREVWSYLHYTDDEYADGLPYWHDPTFQGRYDELVFAAKCLHRYIDWLRAAGRDY